MTSPPPPIAEVLALLGVDVRRRRFRCVSPEHEDRNPASAVYSTRSGTERFHCHACGADGDVWDLVCLALSLSKRQGYRWLRERFPALKPVRAPKPRGPTWKDVDRTLAECDIGRAPGLEGEWAYMLDDLYFTRGATPKEQIEAILAWYAWALPLAKMRLKQTGGHAKIVPAGT